VAIRLEFAGIARGEIPAAMLTHEVINDEIRRASVRAAVVLLLR
jgi:hypothetical protein